MKDPRVQIILCLLLDHAFISITQYMVSLGIVLLMLLCYLYWHVALVTIIILILDDIDECLQESICPAGTRCINTFGSYTCTCDAGYFLMNTDGGGNTCNGKKFLLILKINRVFFYLQM